MKKVHVKLYFTNVKYLIKVMLVSMVQSDYMVDFQRKELKM